MASTQAPHAPTSTDGVHIRAAQAGEHGLLSQIAYRAKAHWGYSRADLDAWQPELVVTLESVLERPTFVAELDGAVAGFCQLQVAPPRAELESLWVLPAHMRRGVGRALLMHAAQFLRAAGVRELHIDADPHAEAFYKAHQAVRVGQRSAPIATEPQRVRPQLVLHTGTG